jgi:hypothetical protein
MNERDSEGGVEGLKRTLPDVPEPPVEEMWGEVRAAMEVPSAGGPALFRESARAGGTLTVRRRSLRVPLAVAASLVLGFGLGRAWGAGVGGPAGPDPVGGDPGAGEFAPPARISSALPPEIADRFARRHISEAGALLTLVQAGGAESMAPEDLRGWGRELLGQGRFLSTFDSLDAETRSLVQDLELIMVQFAGLPSGDEWEPEREETEMSLIRAGMDRYQVLDRIDRKLPTVNQDREE